MFLQSKAPFRPKAEVSQSYNDGVVEIFSITDTAENGYFPQVSYDSVVTLPYQERKLGISRYYSAKQNQINVNRVIRVPAPSAAITNQNVAETEDGVYYRIDLVQIVPDVWPRSYDLTLVLFDQGAPKAPDPDEPDEPDEPTDPTDPTEPPEPEDEEVE